MKMKAPLRTIAILVVLACSMLFAVGVSADAPQPVLVDEQDFNLIEFGYSPNGSAPSANACTAPFDNSVYLDTSDCSCEKPDRMTIRYLGDGPTTITIGGNGSGGPFTNVNTGDTFTITVSGNEPTFTATGQSTQAIHTSCSAPLYPGWTSRPVGDPKDTQGGPFEVVSFSTNGVPFELANPINCPLGSLGDRVIVGTTVPDNGSELGVGGVTVNLYGGNCPVDPSQLTVASRLKTTTTDGSGVYTFSDLMPGEYCIAPDNGTLPTYYTLSTASPLDAASHSDTVLTCDFGYFPEEPEVEITKDLLSSEPVLVGQEVEFKIRVRNIGDTTIQVLPLQDLYDATMFEFLSATPNVDDNVNDGVIDWSDLTQAGPKGFDQELPPASFFDVFVNFRALQATTTTSAAASALSAASINAPTVEPDVDGLLDDSYVWDKYFPKGPDDGNTTLAPGNLYTYEGASVCYYAFVVDRAFNDNVYADAGLDDDYMKLDGWFTEHSYGKLEGSDKAIFSVSYPGGSHDNLEVDYIGGSHTVEFFDSPINAASSSLVANIDQSGWTGGSWGDVEKHSPAFDYNQTSGKYWEWLMIYEFSIPKSDLGETCGEMTLAGAHNSPNKDQDAPNIGSIGDLVWEDSDGNGGKEVDEPGIANVTMNLYQGGTLVRIAHTQTGTTGLYIFSNLAGGTYTVEVDDSTLPAAYTLTTPPEPRNVTIPTDGSDMTVDFGYTQGTASIGDRVFYDLNDSGLPDDGSEPGLNGITVDLYKGVCPASGQPYKTQVTSGNGNYDFTNLPEDDYCVDVDESTLPFGFGSTTTQPLDVDLGDGVDYNDADFGYLAECPPGTIPNVGMSTGAEDENGQEANTAVDYICVEVIPVRGAIGDFIWYDTDADGIEDIGEKGISNVAVDLYKDSNNSRALEIGVDQLVASTQTDADGGYLFPKLEPAVYFVDVTDAANPNGTLNGLIHTLGNQSMDDPAGPINLLSGEVYKDADFGYVRELNDKALIGDTVWYDANGDGKQQPGELGIAGVTVYTSPQDGFIAPQAALTDENGHYRFPVTPSSYIISVSRPSGLTPTTPESHGPVTVAAGDQYLKADFGYNGEGLGMIGDLVFEDENENGQYDGVDTILAGVSVSLIRDENGNGAWEQPDEPIIATVTTDSSLDADGGNYKFYGVPAGRYLVHVSDTNGVLLDYYRGPFGTPNENNHSQVDPYPVVLPGGDNLKADFGYVPLNIQDKGVTGNQVWLESDGNGIFNTVSGDIGQHGVTVELLQNSNVIATTTTGASGDYAFLHLPPGQYDTQVSDVFDVLNGFQPTIYPADQSSDHTNKIQAYPTGLATGGVNLTADFGYLCTPNLSGYVWKDMNLNGQRDPGEAGIANIEVALLDDTAGYPLLAITRTDANGFYSFDPLPAGDYVIDVNNSYINYNLQLFLTTPPEPMPHNLGECEIGLHDFGYGPKSGVIGDFVWYDVNQNAQQDEWYDANDDGQYDEWFDINNNGFIDEGELDKCGLRLIPVFLKDATGAPLDDTVTDHFGFYNFIDLPGGIYRVGVDQTAVYERATEMAVDGKCKPLPSGAPLTTAAQADAEPVSELLDITEVKEGEIVLARSGPEQIPADIGGQVREDRDADGDLSDPDSGIAGVTIELYLDNNVDGNLDAGDTFVTDTTTVAGGTYLFPDVVPAQYIVVEVDPSGFGSTNDTAPPNNNQIPVEVGSGPTHTGNDFLDTSVTCYLSPNGDFIIDLPDGGIYLDADFAASCVFGTGAIGDFVWYDANRDAIQDVGEPGIANVTLDLYEDTDGNGSGDTLVDSTVTGADGGYLFRDVPPGDYIVDVTDAVNPNGTLNGLVHTIGPQSQPDPSNLITLVAGEVYKDADFGYVEPDTGQVIIGDTIWYDTDGDGFQQPWEIGIPGVTVTATSLSGANGSAVTDDLGRYRIVALPGSYIVQPDPAPAGLTATTSETYDTGLLLAGEYDLDADFGYRSDLSGTIGNLVFEDTNENGEFDFGDSPLAGVSVDLIRDLNFNGVWDAAEPIIATTTTTNVLDGFNGNYQFTGLPSGNYLVHVSDTNAILINYVKSVLGTPGQDNNNQADPYAASISLPLGAVNVTADFGYVKIDRPNTSVIGSQVWLESIRNGIFNPGENDIGQPGVTVDLYKDGVYVKTTTTGASGDYSFTSLPSGNYSVEVSDDHNVLLKYALTTLGPAPGDDNNNQAQPYAFSVPEKASNLTADFGYYNPPSDYTITKVLNTPEPVGEKEELDFTITITNIGSTWMTIVPLQDDYDPEYLEFKFADYLPSTVDSVNGVLVWDDITTNPDNDLAPGESFSVKVTFKGLKDTTDPWVPPNGETINTATVLNAWADPDGPNEPVGSVIPLPQRSAQDDVWILKKTGVRLTGLATEAVDGTVLVSWETLTEVNIIGFNVLRVQRVSGGGDYATVNEEFMLAEYAGADSGRKYEYRDESVEAGTTYEYMLEVLRADGGVIHLKLPMVTTSG